MIIFEDSKEDMSQVYELSLGILKVLDT